MGRGNDSFGKKEVRAKQDKKRKAKEQKRINRKQQSRDGNNLNEMIAYVDEFGNITASPPDLSKKKEINPEEIEIKTARSADPDPADIYHKGVVTFFNTSKGFGFIKDSATQKDIFVHVNALTEPIKENNKVIFEIMKGPRGLSASNVKIDRAQEE